MGEKTIPILPCPSIPDVVAFYQALGFELTDAERASLSDDLARADDLRESLRP